MVKVFNKKILVDNINYLLNYKGIKASEIEKEISVSPGYISRIVKDDANKPNLDFIMSFSQAMEVSMETLLYSNITQLSKNDDYLIKFINKLIDDTVNFKLDWKDNKEESREISLLYQFEPKIVPNTPVLFISLKNFYLYFFKINETISNGGCYSNYDYQELWLINSNGKFSPSIIASTRYEWQKRYIYSLANIIGEYLNHPTLDSDAKSVIDAFMNDDIQNTDSDYELPF